MIEESFRKTAHSFELLALALSKGLKNRGFNNRSKHHGARRQRAIHRIKKRKKKNN